MSRYIDAEKVMGEINRIGGHNLCEWETIGIKALIDRQPTADVVEVRHGTWYHGNDGGAVYAKCSACGRRMNYSCYGYAYCCLCGARMDGERSEGDDA